MSFQKQDGFLDLVLTSTAFALACSEAVQWKLCLFSEELDCCSHWWLWSCTITPRFWAGGAEIALFRYSELEFPRQLVPGGDRKMPGVDRNMPGGAQRCQEGTYLLQTLQEDPKDHGVGQVSHPDGGTLGRHTGAAWRWGQGARGLFLRSPFLCLSAKGKKYVSFLHLIHVTYSTTTLGSQVKDWTIWSTFSIEKSTGLPSRHTAMSQFGQVKDFSNLERYLLGCVTQL